MDVMGSIAIGEDALCLPEAAVTALADGAPLQGKNQREISEFRLKAGIWLRFRRKTGKREFEQIPVPDRESLIQAFVSEGENCLFTDRTTGCVVPAGILAHSAA